MSPVLDVNLTEQPRMRGVLHEASILVFAIADVVLLALARSRRIQLAVAIYAVGQIACLGMSAVYHRGAWRPRVKRILGRFDHAAIFLLIAGTYTPICLGVLKGSTGIALLIGAWSGAAVGIAMSLVKWEPPVWLEVTPYLVTGWIAVLALPALLTAMGWGAMLLAAGGGLLYTAGAIVYGSKWPNPRPRTFGYHEIFHACVVAATAAFSVLMFVWVVPSAA